MEAKLNKVKFILHKYNQEHLLNFYKELTNVQKDKLLDQILNINFDLILHLYEQS